MKIPTITISAVVTMLMLAGCISAEEIEANQRRLTSQCKFHKCECVSPQKYFPLRISGDKAPVMWTERGDPYCPKDYRLSLLQSSERPGTGIQFPPGSPTP